MFIEGNREKKEIVLPKLRKIVDFQGLLICSPCSFFEKIII